MALPEHIDRDAGADDGEENATDGIGEPTGARITVAKVSLEALRTRLGRHRKAPR